MAETPSTMVELGTDAPDFSLPDINGKLVSLADFEGSEAFLVMFICNHCPYVHHIRRVLAERTEGWMKRGVDVVAINSNDAINYPGDSPERMVEEVANHNYRFPYLYDETQEVAKAYHATCTPDFFLYNRNRKLAYRGQLDKSRPGNGLPVTGKDIERAVTALLGGKQVAEDQVPSVGCNIKWRV